MFLHRTKCPSHALNFYGYFNIVSLFHIIKNNLSGVVSYCVRTRNISLLNSEVNKLDPHCATRLIHEPTITESGGKIQADQQLIKGCQFSCGSFRFKPQN
jgi:hypothetical protein